MNYGQPGNYGQGGYGGYGGHGGYGGPGMPVGPREHPSATTALVLGLGGMFCLGAFLGVPAIVVGRGVVNAVQAEPHRWRGAGSAQAGIVLGWISVVETAFVVATTATSSGSKAAIALLALSVVALGLFASGFASGLPKPLAVVGRTLRRAPLAVGLTLLGLLGGSGVGLVGAVSRKQEAVRRCDAARAQYTESAKTERFDAIRSAIAAVERDCPPDVNAVATMRRELDAREAAAAARNAEEERARQAKLAAEKEKRAVETFPEQKKQIAALIKSAQAKGWQGQAEAAAADLASAQRALDAFEGTSVAQTKEFADLTAQIAEKRKAIQPQLDRIAEKRRREAAAAELRVAVLGPKPVNSAWDGSVPEVERYLRQTMHDWSSYEHVSTTEPAIEGDCWVVISTFRGNNAFGAKIINTKKFYIQQRQVVRVADVD